MGAGGHLKVLNRPENQHYGCYGAPRVPYTPRKYAQSTGNQILAAIPRIFFQLPLSSEIAQFENFARLDPAELKPIVVERWSLSVVYL